MFLPDPGPFAWQHKWGKLPLQVGIYFSPFIAGDRAYGYTEKNRKKQELSNLRNLPVQVVLFLISCWRSPELEP